MLKKSLVVALFVSQGITLCLAQTTQPTPPVNPHKAHDQKIQECRKQAQDLGLQGEDRRAFIAECVRK